MPTHIQINLLLRHFLSCSGEWERFLNHINVKSMKGVGNLAVITAYNKGYRINNEGKLCRNNIILKGHTSSGLYPLKSFCIRVNGKKCNFNFHRLCAYQKYRERAFEAECVRHLNGDSLDNRPCNIELGTHKENSLDIPKRTRVKLAKNASSYMDKYENMVSDIKKYHNEVKSYKKTMEKFGITSKGALWYILNKR